jgi:glutamate-1-semialdehyde 2,1-aminomutase
MSGPHPSDYRQHPLAQRAHEVMPAGNTRTTVFVPPTPPFAVSGSGAWVTDQLGHRVIDCNNNYTALIHGHADPHVQAAVMDVIGAGTAFGLPTETEVALAEHLAQRTSIERWRFSNSGTEAVMTAIRGARAHTGRDVIVRFAGSYHGTTDAVVDQAAPGVPRSIGASVVVVPQGDRHAFDAALVEHGDDLAAVLIDLMPNRAGLEPADGDFVRHVREATTARGALLIVDEVISFRLAVGGLHRSYGIEPDLVTLGKVVGGGFPVGAVGGRADVMAVFDPTQGSTVGWGGTFSANPITMTAGLAALHRFGEDEVDRLNARGDALRGRLGDLGVAVSGRGSLLRIRETVDLGSLWWHLYRSGVLAGTNGLIALSTPMTDDDVAAVADSVAAAVSQTKNEETGS